MSDFDELKISELWIKGRELGASIISFDTVLCGGDEELYEQTQQMLKYVISAYVEGGLLEKKRLFTLAVEECRGIMAFLNVWAKDNYNSFDIVAPIIFQLNDYVDIISIEIKRAERLSA